MFNSDSVSTGCIKVKGVPECEGVMSRIQTSHTTCMHEVCHTCEYVMCHTCEWIMCNRYFFSAWLYKAKGVPWCECVMSHIRTSTRVCSVVYRVSHTNELRTRTCHAHERVTLACVNEVCHTCERVICFTCKRVICHTCKRVMCHTCERVMCHTCERVMCHTCERVMCHTCERVICNRDSISPELRQKSKVYPSIYMSIYIQSSIYIYTPLYVWDSFSIGLYICRAHYLYPSLQGSLYMYTTLHIWNSFSIGLYIRTVYL